MADLLTFIQEQKDKQWPDKEGGLVIHLLQYWTDNWTGLPDFTKCKRTGYDHFLLVTDATQYRIELTFEQSRLQMVSYILPEMTIHSIKQIYMHTFAEAIADLNHFLGKHGCLGINKI